MQPRALVVGLGRTGLSVVKHLLANGWQVSGTDSRTQPPSLAAVQALAADRGVQLTLRTGGFDAALLDGADCVVVSPGVPSNDPLLNAARARGLEVVGDIELFARAVNGTARTVGITGTNGKSTVTTLVANMAARAGLKVRAGGNLGEPALELLGDGSIELYVLELSSYQLEVTSSLELAAATVLNVTPDHLDRYVDVAGYAAAKARIFARCATAVINLDDPLVAAMLPAAARAGTARLSFSLRASVGADYELQQHQGAWWLGRRGAPLLAVADMHITGLHNAANALAALALGDALGLPQAAMLAELREFPGLAHRAQWVADVRGVRYVNDSKGTNVGATLAAVEGMVGPLLVIAGGDGKQQDFSPLAAAFTGKVRHALLIGRDARAVGAALRDACETRFCASLEEAVSVAAQLAQPGDTVLLSPACASLDMFRDYTHRGQVFADAVQRLAA